jgi:DNA-binding cell septation regulator SpoVG
MAPEKAKPAGTSGGHRDFLITNWKAHRKNTLQGFLSITLPSGLVIHNCTLHESSGVRWIGLPARPYTKDDGSTSYATLIEFSTAETRHRFQTAALEAVGRFMEAEK